MIVRIGVTENARELSVELDADSDEAELRSNLEAALENGKGFFWLTDRRGRQVGVPAARIAYVEIGGAGREPSISLGALLWMSKILINVPKPDCQHHLPLRYPDCL